MKRNLICLLVIVLAICSFGKEITQKGNDSYPATPRYEVIRQLNWNSANHSLTGEIKIKIKFNNVWEEFVIPINLRPETSSSFLFARNTKDDISVIKCPSALKISNLLRLIPREERTDFVASNVEAAGQIEILRAKDDYYNLNINFYHLATKFTFIHTGEFITTYSWNDKEPFPIVINNLTKDSSWKFVTALP